MDADPEPPFIRRFREITEGKRTMPKTMARKQHYVPSFLLARWATPKTRKGALATIEVAIGEVVTRSPGKVALQRDLYTLDKGTASINLGVEALLGIVEENAAEAIKRLEAAPERISMDDRATIAYFLAIQQGRTPPGLEQHGTVARAAAEEALHAFFQNTTAVADRYREKCNPDADMEEIRAFAIQQITAFKEGRLTIELPEEARFQAMAKTISAIAYDVAQDAVDAADGRRRVHRQRPRARDVGPASTRQPGQRLGELAARRDDVPRRPNGVPEDHAGGGEL